MAQQHINLGTAPAGSDGDTNRTAWTKTEANFNELYGRGLPIGRNLLINAQGRINQRAFAGGALAAGVYGYDRWKAGTGGCNIAINATTGVFTHTSGPLVQVIEAPRVAGQVVTFSVEDPSGPVGVNVDGVTGTISAGSGRRSLTLTVPSGSTGNVTLTVTAVGVTYKNPQLEAGDAARSFDVRPVGLELALCQRYFELYAPVHQSAAAFNAGDLMWGLQWAVPKRVPPAIVTSGSPGWVGNGLTGTLNNILLQNIGLNGCTADSTSFTGSVTQGLGYGIRGVIYAIDAEL